MTTPQDIAKLKLFGHLPNVEVEDLGRDSVLSIQPPKGVLENRWCIHPDFEDAEIASYEGKTRLLAERIGSYVGIYEYECESVIKSHRKMLAAKGNGSWPFACNPQFPNNHSVKVYVELDTFAEIHTRRVWDKELEGLVRAGTWRMSRTEVFDRWAGKPLLNVAMGLCNESFRRVGCAHIMVDDGPEGKEHNIHIKSEIIPGSTIGYAYFNDGTCSDHVLNFIDSTWDGGLHGLARLLTHECGHNHNLQHQFDNQHVHHSVMSYDAPNSGLFYGFSTGENPYYLPRDYSMDSLVRHYGDEEVLLENPPTEPIDKTVYEIPGIFEGRELSDGTYAVDGEITIPEGARGKTFIMQRVGDEAKHKLIRKAEI